MGFRPPTPPPGRLLRLGVVLDTRNAPARIGEVARMCDRAGVDALWVRDRLAAPDGEPRVEAWTALALAAGEVRRARLGAVVDVAFRPPGVMAAMAGTLDAAIGGRLELAFTAGWSEAEHRSFGLPFPDPTQRTERLEAYARAVRTLLTGSLATAGEPFPLEDAELGVASPQPGGPPTFVEATSPAEIAAAGRVADGVLVPGAAVRDADRAVEQIRRASERAGRDPATVGIALEVPVSVGRTWAEAQARAEAESLFDTVGHPSAVGIFGTLEQCQEGVIRLAHAGVTDLRCVLPNSPDVHDVIAQLTAMVVGTVDVLSPGAPKSRAPDPPLGWGGRRMRRGGDG